MKGIPQKVSEHVRELNPQLFGGPAVDRQLTKADALSAVELKEEKKFQAMCECQLEQWGYYRLTASTAGRGDRGYFGHLAKPIGNPLMPDLFIFGLDGRCLMVEIKTRNVYQPGQREMIEAGFWKLATTFSEFVQIVMEWSGINGSGAVDWRVG